MEEADNNGDVEMTEEAAEPAEEKSASEKDSKAATKVNKKAEKKSTKKVGVVASKKKKGKKARIKVVRNVEDDDQVEEEDDEDEDDEEENTEPPKVYIPGRYELDEDEELECDETAYVMLHRFTTEHPCLSFDAIYDKLGDNRSTFPLSCTLVAGTTQAPKSRDNMIVVMKLENLQKIKQKDKKKKEDDDSSSSSSESSSDDSDSDESNNSNKKPRLFTAKIPHHGGINRIRACKGMNACAAWNDQGKVQIWNLSAALDALETTTDRKSSGGGGGEQVISLKQEKPLFSFSGHQAEGFAMDWSKVTLGKFASGDIRKNIHIWRMLEGGVWSVDQRPLNAHKASVEDLQWSPNEDDMLASCSSDKTIRLWDTRMGGGSSSVCVVERAHQDSDVNVISWNPADPTLLLSGGDDGAIKVWDWKFISRGHPVAVLKHHTAPITSVNWYPPSAGDDNSSTVFAASGDDDQVSVWDLAVEPDDEREIIMEEEANGAAEDEKVPAQLLFIHQGQHEIKEIQWHPQLPGVILSTALDGFNIFRTVSV